MTLNSKEENAYSTLWSTTYVNKKGGFQSLTKISVKNIATGKKYIEKHRYLLLKVKFNHVNYG
jgi:hypothetical protein